MGASTMEVVGSEVDLFAPTLQQSVITDDYRDEIRPVAPITHGTPITFEVTGSPKQHIDLRAIKMDVLLKITKADGSAPAANAVGVVNNTLHSLFKEMTAELNQRPVSDTSALHHYKAYFETLLNYREDVQKTRLLAEGWTKDTVGKMDVTEVGKDNTGLNDRSKRFNQGALVRLSGRPHLDIFTIGRLLAPDVKLRVNCVPASDEFVLKTAAPAANAAQEKYKMEIVSANLKVCDKELKNEVLLAHQQINAKMPMRYPMSRTSMMHVTIPTGSSAFQYPNLFNGNLPDLVIIGLVRDEDYAGHYNKNPYNFQNFGLDHVTLKRNGMAVPRSGYTPKFAEKDYIKDYVTMLEELGRDQGNDTVALTPEEWADGYNLYAFHTTPGPIGSGAERARSQFTKGNLKLELNFSKATTTLIQVIVYAQMWGQIEIDDKKSVIIS